MQLSYPELMKLSELQMKLFHLSNHIAQIKGMLKQLSDDQCAVQIAFGMHNQTQCEKNKAQQQAEVVMVDDETALREIMAQVTGRRVMPQKSCKNNVAFFFSETAGIRILSLVLREKEAERLELHQQAEDLLLKLTPSPIQLLHNEH